MTKIKIATVIGARPQFIKASAFSNAIRNCQEQVFEEFIIHTGQHFDSNMSDVFFKDLEIPEPTYNLGIAGGGHGAMTGAMMLQLEETFYAERPNLILVYGDTNSTLAAGLVASKMHIPVVHVEAGLRSFNKKMPEEINRVLTDHVSDFLFCPTDHAVENLKNENITKNVFNVGDIMIDVCSLISEKSKLRQQDQKPTPYALATIHRAENTGSKLILENIFNALSRLSRELEVVFPMHPRTLKAAEDFEIMPLLHGVQLLPPQDYPSMIRLLHNAQVLITDSGGMQKESFFLRTQCVTLRTETEWVETVELGWNKIVDPKSEEIETKVNDSLSSSPNSTTAQPYGSGDTANLILTELMRNQVDFQEELQ